MQFSGYGSLACWQEFKPFGLLSGSSPFRNHLSYQKIVIGEGIVSYMLRSLLIYLEASGFEPLTFSVQRRRSTN